MKCPKCRKKLELQSYGTYNESGAEIIQKIYGHCCGEIQVERLVKPKQGIDFLNFKFELEERNGNI